MRWFGESVRSRVHGLAAVASVVLLAAGLSSCSGAAQPGSRAASAAQAQAQAASVPVKAVTVPRPRKVRAANQAAPEFKATKTQWPSAASGSAALAAPAAGRTAGPETRIAGTPVWVQDAGTLGAAASAYRGPARVSVTMLPHAAAGQLGISAVVFDVSGSGPAGRVRVGLDYASFAQAYGGNYGSRLQLVELPACALTTPQVPACRREVPLGSAQDYRSSSVSAVVNLGGAQASLLSYVKGSPATLTSAGGMVIGATDSTGQEGGEGGTYAASVLKPAGTWAEGGDSGAFTYTYPITMPSASGPLVPSLSLDYDSQEVDGQTAQAHLQSSWLGDGWETTDSSIQLSTIPCDDDPEGTASPDATTDECYDGDVVEMSLGGTDTPLVFASSSTSGGVTTSKWRAENDNGAVITHVSAASTVFGKYSTGADYWTVTERDGTEYYFGLQHLPGWASSDTPTASADTMPVYSAHSGDPCYSSSGFASSVCTMAYQWHLDYVTDTSGDAMAYDYYQTTNYYGEDGGASDVPYTSDSYLTNIDYGFRAGGAYGTVPDQVVFNAKARCTATTCGALSTSNSSVGTQYPDVPVDLICAKGTKCTAYAPSLFSEVRLGSITTEQYSTTASAYEDIDTYAFNETEPTSDDSLSPTLWLNSIQRTGDDTSAGATGDAVPLTVSFGKTDLQNRVFTSTYPGLYRYRIVSVTSETGALTTVNYATPDPCSSSYSSSSGTSVTSANTDSCFPVFWTPSGSSAPVLDWFESYAVTQVLTADQTGGSLTEESDYAYGGGAAWHYDDTGAVQSKYRSWGQFRGYASVTVRTGEAANNPQTESETAYYRGMNGDTLPSGTASVSLTDSQGGAHTDYDPLAGNPLETTTYLGSTGPLNTSAITSYWVSAATASSTPTGSPTETAYMAEPAETWTRTALTDGGETGDWDVTETDSSYDAQTGDADFGLLEYSYTHTDPVNTAYDSCTRDQYAPVNTSENLAGLIAYTETDKVACSGYTAGSPASVPGALNSLGAPASVSASQVSGSTETFYDDPAFSTTFPQTAAPTAGNVTMTRRASGGTPGSFTWQTESRDTYDAYGRVEDAYDADGNETVTSYTVNAAGLTTGEAVAAPATVYVNSGGTDVTTTHDSSQTLDPTRNLVLTSTDQNGVVTTEQYDSLGRLAGVWKDSRSAKLTANVTYTYTVSSTSLSGVLTETLNEEGNQVPSVTIYDSLGRVRQTQTLATTPTGVGRLVTDTFYDSRGWVSTLNSNYYDDTSYDSTTEPVLFLVPVNTNEVPDQEDYVYDGTGRQVEDISENDGTVVSTSVTAYNGDSVTVLPGIPGNAASSALPARTGTVQTTKLNPLGQTTALDQYTADPSLSVPSNPGTAAFYVTGGTPDATSYGYDAQGNQDSETTGGQTWSQAYNLLGQETSSTDPDAGTTTMSYDADGNLLQSKDAMGNYTSSTYDQLGRQTAKYAAASTAQQPYASTSSPGNETASWVYDNANSYVKSMPDADGQATTFTSYSGGYAYTTQQGGFNAFGESTGELFEIPAGSPAAAFGTSLAYSYSYDPINGTPLKTTFPAAGGLPLETVTYSTTTALDLPSGVGGLNGYSEAASYTAYGQLEQATLGAGSDEAFVTDSYDSHTGNLTGQLVTRSTATPANVDNDTYAYDTAGQVTSETDQRLGSSAQTEAQCYTYTPQDQLAQAWTATDACAATPTTSSYGTVGDPLGTASEYDESWTYNAAGQRVTQSALDPAVGAFATTSYGYTAGTGEMTSANTTGAVTSDSTFGYNADGQQNSRDTSAGNQNLSWTNGELASVTTAGTGTTDATYAYGTDGSLLLSTEGSVLTLYLPDEELTDSGGTIAGVRYYPLPGGATAVRTGSGTAYGFEIESDQHGTNTLYLDDTAQDPSWRQFDPYGSARTTTAWPDNRGFLNDPTSTQTSLTSIGPRWYDPVTGSFTSLDPLLETSSPLELNGYTYATQNPVNDSDPTGEFSSYGDPGSGQGCVGTAQSCAPILTGQQNNNGGGAGSNRGGTASAPGGGTGGTSTGTTAAERRCIRDIFRCWPGGTQMNEDFQVGDGNNNTWDMTSGGCILSTDITATPCLDMAASDDPEGGQQGGFVSVNGSNDGLLRFALGILFRAVGEAAAEEATEGAVGDGLAEGKAESEIQTYEIQKLGEEAGETDATIKDLRDTAENVAQNANAFRGVPPENMISNSPVSTGGTPEMNNAVPPGGNVSVEGAAMALGVLAWGVYLKWRQLFGS
jgi:RHS repeat-associated protein